MNIARTYQHYSDSVKEEIVRTGNVYAFPHLKIPRTTAQYWVKRHKLKPQKNFNETDSLYKQKAEHLAEQLAKEASLRCLLETVRKLFPYDFQKVHTNDGHLKFRFAQRQKICANGDPHSSSRTTKLQL